MTPAPVCACVCALVFVFVFVFVCVCVCVCVCRCAEWAPHLPVKCARSHPLGVGAGAVFVATLPTTAAAAAAGKLTGLFLMPIVSQAPGSSVLQMLVSSEGVLKLPTISKLIQEPFFSTASASVPTIKPSFKASARVRTALKECWEHAEQTTTAKQHIIEQRRKTAKLEEEKRAKEEEREEAKVRKARKANQITVTK